MSDRPNVISLRQAMDELLNDSIVGTPFRMMGSRAGNSPDPTVVPLPLDVYATQDAVIVLAAAPGCQPEHLQITYNQGTLLLSGTIPNVADSGEAKGATWYVHELWNGRFQRAVSLPVEVNVGQAQASCEQGIVKIVLPKAEQAKPTTIPIRVPERSQSIGVGH